MQTDFHHGLLGGWSRAIGVSGVRKSGSELSDSAKFVADQLAGLEGRGGVLHAATYASMHQPAGA
jgi:hypothetical protein